MSDKIAAKGYTRAVLVLNMKKFVQGSENKSRFESIRGSDTFADTLRSAWPKQLPIQPCFRRVDGDGMSVEDVGFATGVFRSLMLDRLTAPTYKLDKSRVKFPDDLETNFQFKTLFKRVWDRWDIYIRPTMTGFFVIQLIYRYQDVPRAMIELAKDTIKLQEPLDVPSAVNWLKYNRERYAKQPDKLLEKEQSVRALLRWLGADVAYPQASKMLYYPVQWKVAIEVINLFIKDGRFSLPHKEGKIPLSPVFRSSSLPVHDSFVIYHFDELLAEPKLVQCGKRSEAKRGVKMSISLNELRKSNQLRNALVSLMEGTVLREPERPEESQHSNGYFPAPRWSRADALLSDPKQNLASWNDELCVFNHRTAIIMPSRRWRNHEMAVSTVPSATLKVEYGRYWEAIIRLIEFVLEIRVLVQLIEGDSYRMLTQIANTIEGIRADMFSGDIVISNELEEQMARAAHLRRIAALAQSISHAPFWARAEYAVQKAERLLELLDVPRILTHIERNIDSINSVADHVDELYIADLSEKSNDKATLLSIGLAALSFIVTFLALPSFWVDLTALVRDYDWGSPGLYSIIFYTGTSLGFGLVFFALVMLIMALWRQGVRRLLNIFMFRGR